MISIVKRPERITERIVISLPIKVEAHALQDGIWRELTHLETVSDCGAGFYLSRSFETGQLLFLTMPVGNEFRRYDFDKEHYSIWGIVRHSYKTLRHNFSVYHIGVALIGAEPPASYRQNPLTIYKLGELGKNGLWQISETSQAQPKPRQPRYTIPIDIVIAVCDENDNIIAHENTVTENISHNGAAVFSGLQVNVGDRVRIIKRHGNFSANAIVRNRRIGNDNLPRLHLEFVNVNFPLESID